ncbi:hypothetical protein BHM03_00039506 [Ensete ventricosum]|uniref:Uncharacterized protein n=1 Tax=Ensete ventricosum TaxID=4639 RepID=A0A445MK29_ENSVE|nr:hypothetical protein BHM03_00039506 [Ensete ventricosum]
MGVEVNEKSSDRIQRLKVLACDAKPTACALLPNSHLLLMVKETPCSVYTVQLLLTDGNGVQCLTCGKSCRLRWINYLRPDIKRGNFTKEEEDTIIKLHGVWSKIASHLPGRTDNEIKNVWNTHLKKRLVFKEHNNPEEALSSSSSSTLPSCSDQGDNKSDEERNNPCLHSHDSSLEVIEIPIEPMDLWSMLDEEPRGSTMIISSASSTQLSTMNHGVDQEVVPDVLIDPDIWSMIQDEDACSLTLETLQPSNSSAVGEESNREGNDSEWLEYLEEELGLREAAAVEDQGSPVRGAGEQPHAFVSFVLEIPDRKHLYEPRSEANQSGVGLRGGHVANPIKQSRPAGNAKWLGRPCPGMYDQCRRFDTESRLLTRLNPTVRTGRHAHRRWSRLVKERTKERRVEHWKTMKLGRSRESVTPSINQVRPGPPADAPTGNAAALAPEP